MKPDDTHADTTTADPPQILDLRDYFATFALNGFISAGLTVRAMIQFQDDDKKAMREMSKAAYDFADAMLEARKS